MANTAGDYELTNRTDTDVDTWLALPWRTSSTTCGPWNLSAPDYAGVAAETLGELRELINRKENPVLCVESSCWQVFKYVVVKIDCDGLPTIAAEGMALAMSRDEAIVQATRANPVSIERDERLVVVIFGWIQVPTL